MAGKALFLKKLNSWGAMTLVGLGHLAPSLVEHDLFETPISTLFPILPEKYLGRQLIWRCQGGLPRPSQADHRLRRYAALW
jgi:hypothetical protein